MIEKILFTLHVYFIEVLHLILKNMNFSWNSSRAQILIERIFIFCATLSIFVQKTMIMKYIVLSFKAIAEIIDRERLNKMFTMQSFRSFDRMIEVSDRSRADFVRWAFYSSALDLFYICLFCFGLNYLFLHWIWCGNRYLEREENKICSNKYCTESDFQYICTFTQVNS